MKKNLVQDDAHKPKKSSLRWLLVVPFVIVLALLATIRRQGEHLNNVQADRQETVASHNSSSDNSDRSRIRNNIRSYVRAEINDYEYSKLGGIHNLKISVINTSDYHLDKVRVKIKYIKANGSVWDTRYEDFYDVKSSATATHRIPDTKRGTRVEYEISSVKSKILGL